MHIDTAGAWWILGIFTIIIFCFLAFEYQIPFRKESSLFYARIWATAIWGGTLTFFLPIALNLGFGPNDDGRVLRQLLLYTTGGVLGVITLSETRRKNDLEKSKFDEQQDQFREQLKAQDEKDKREHNRQIHTERRSRYATAVEHLADKSATIRRGGVYTLIGLVDEWISDPGLTEDDQKKEGQVIINTLCSYIRSPFSLAEKRVNLESTQASDDQEKLREEQDVRQAIFHEMGKRGSTFKKNKNGKVVHTPGAWSRFDFNFSQAPIFYPLSNLTIEKANFSSASFYGDANFRMTFFAQNADFRNAIFTQNAFFDKASFEMTASFDNVTFAQGAFFTGATFAQNAIFREAIFAKESASNQEAEASFLKTIFNKEVNFYKAVFKQEVNFRKTTFTQSANFSRTFFTQNVNFREVTFTQNAKFKLTKFDKNANFRQVTFSKSANFRGAIFLLNANFDKAVFTQNANFRDVRFKNIKPTFVSGNSRAQFSVIPYQHSYSFSFHATDSQAVRLGAATLHGKTFNNIPHGTVLFDPNSPKDQHGNYIVHSDPAK